MTDMQDIRVALFSSDTSSTETIYIPWDSNPIFRKLPDIQVDEGEDEE